MTLRLQWSGTAGCWCPSQRSRASTGEFDTKRQHLNLTSDPRALALNDITYQFTSTPPPQLPHWGGYVNYALFGTSALSGSEGYGFADTLGAGLTASIFGPYGVGTAGILINSQSAVDSPESVVLLDVNWRWDDLANKTTLLVGDTVSTPGWWGRAVRFGGVQYGTNFSLQPGFVTYPLMAVSGLATVPSTADILINNVRVAEQAVPAGPFSISNLPTMTGAGELNMVVRDAFGQQQVVTQPFYIAQQLLRPGLTEFSVGAGAGRLNYGLTNLDYGGTIAYGWARHGISANLTGELRAEADADGAAVGAGTDVLVGNLGVLSVGGTATQGPQGNGTRYLVGFDRQTPFLSFGARFTRASENYREIGDFGPQISQWSTGLSCEPPSRSTARLAFGYTGQRYYDAEPLTIYSASYSINVGARAFLTLTGSKFLGRAGRDPGAGSADDPDRQPDQRDRVGAVDSPRTARPRASARPCTAILAGRRRLRLLRAREHRSPRRRRRAVCRALWSLHARSGDRQRPQRAARERCRRHRLGRRHDDVRAADRTELRRRQGR